MQTRLSFFSLLYGMPAPSSECQHPEAWPASIYGHLRESVDFGVSVNKLFVTIYDTDNIFQLVY